MLNKVILSILLTLLLCAGCGGGGSGGSDESTSITGGTGGGTPTIGETIAIADLCSTTDGVRFAGNYDFTFVDVDQDPNAPTEGTLAMTEDCQFNLLVKANPQEATPRSLTIGDFSIREQNNVAIWNFTGRPGLRGNTDTFFMPLEDGNRMPITLSLTGVFVVEEDPEVTTALRRSFEGLFASQELLTELQIPNTVTVTSFEQSDTRRVRESEFLLTPWDFFSGHSPPIRFSSSEGFTRDGNPNLSTYTATRDGCTITHNITTLQAGITDVFATNGSFVGLCGLPGNYTGTMFFRAEEDGVRATAYVQYSDRSYFRTLDFMAVP